jgi:hypothetical protein
VPPIVIGNNEKLKYIHNGFYLLYSNHQQTLFYKGSPFSVAGALKYIDSYNGVIVSQAGDTLQLWQAFDCKPTRFEKQLGLAGASLLQLQYGKKYMQGPVLITKHADSTVHWHKKASYHKPWIWAFSSDKLLLNFYGLYKVKQAGRQFYINSDGIKFLKD